MILRLDRYSGWIWQLVALISIDPKETGLFVEPLKQALHNMSGEQFIYEGQGLKEWLLQLVAEEPSKRNQAAAVIGDRFMFPRNLIYPNTRYEDFSAACKEVLKKPDFPAAEFVRKLVAMGIRLETERKAPEPTKQSAEEEAWWEERRKKLETMPDEAGIQWYFKQAFVESPKLFPKEKLQEPGEEFTTSVTIQNIIQVFDVELLPAADGLRQMLKAQGIFPLKAYGVICSMGREGLEFYPEIIAGLKAHSLGPDHGFSFFLPLGHWLREVPEKIPDIIKATESEDALVRENAIMALGYAGRERMKQFSEVEARGLVRIQTGNPRDREAWAWTLGEIAEKPETIDRLLEATMPPDQQHSANAIESLGKLGRESERVVPRLIAILQEIRGMESTLHSRGAYRQAATALSQFGDAAKVAIPSLAKMIWTKPQEYIDENEQVALRREPDEHVITALGRFGADAKEVLPALRQMKEGMVSRAVKEGYASADIGGYVEGCPDHLHEAIRRIEGE